MQAKGGHPGVLATRAAPNPNTQFPTYINLFVKAQPNTWSQKNPEGNVILSVAENHISVDLLTEKIGATATFPAEAFAYGDISGNPRLRKAIVQILQSTFLQNLELDESKVVIAGGATNILESLFFSILDVGDGVLVLAPHYAGYKFDIGFRVQGKCVPVYVDYEGDVAEQLSEARAKSESEGTPIRALLVTHPDNPTGTLFTETSLTALASWCADNSIHLVANEVYGNSVFNEEPIAFRSLYEIGKELKREELQERLHLVYGLSKDFCASGVRIGVIYTDSEPVLGRMKQAGIATAVSFPLQHLMATALLDTSFVHSFISENKKRLKHNYDTLTKIPFQKSQAGLFIMLDLRTALKANDFESEDELCISLAEKGVLLTPGASCEYRIPGFFRLCFATVPAEGLVVAVLRLQEFLSSTGG